MCRDHNDMYIIMIRSKTLKIFAKTMLTLALKWTVGDLNVRVRDEVMESTVFVESME